MPKSKGRRTSRHAPPGPRARANQVKAEGARRITPAQYRRRRIAGWPLVSVGILIGASHWVGHLGVFHIASPGVEDLVAGYPTAMLLGIAGSIVLAKA